jgi:hypothetical protein
MKIALLILGAALALPADQGVPPEVALAVTAFSSEPQAVAPGADGIADLQVESVWVSFKNVAFRDAATCDEAGTPQLKASITVELISGRAIGLPERTKLSSARYCGVELTPRKSRGRADGVSPELRGYSILLRARRHDGTRVVVRSRSIERVWLGANDDRGFAVEGETPRWFLAADLSRWMSGLDLATADVTHDRGNAVIRIDDRNNRELLAAFEASFAVGLGLFVDEDRDGSLQDSERAGEHWLASGEPGASDRVSGLTTSR